MSLYSSPSTSRCCVSSVLCHDEVAPPQRVQGPARAQQEEPQWKAALLSASCPLAASACCCAVCCAAAATLRMPGRH